MWYSMIFGRKVKCLDSRLLEENKNTTHSLAQFFIVSSCCWQKISALGNQDWLKKLLITYKIEITWIRLWK